jgi:hypothetical protein
MQILTFALFAFFADPVADVGATVNKRNTRNFTAPEEPNSLNIDQVQFLQVQHDLRFALPNLLLQLGQVLRPHPTYQSKSRAVLVRVFLNPQGHIRPVEPFTPNRWQSRRQS